jgi:hypothetical protein
MTSLLRLAAKGKWKECHAMLDRRKGDVKERDPVRSALSTRNQQIAIARPPRLCLR